MALPTAVLMPRARARPAFTRCGQISVCVAAMMVALGLQGCASPGASGMAETPRETQALSSSQRVNLALKFDPRNPRLNFVNGLLYESQSTAGSEWRELARIGYQMSHRLDPGFWPADYQLGLMALEERSPMEAQLHLLAAAQKAPREARIWYALARASHCAGDLTTAVRALAKAQALQPVESAEQAETAALVSAASGDGSRAAHWLAVFERSAQSGPRSSPQSDPQSGARASAQAGSQTAAAQELRRRVADLVDASKAADAEPGSALPAAMTPAPAVPAPPPAAAASAATALAAAAVASGPQSAASVAPRAARPKRHTAVVDVVILRRNEIRATTNGINLLDALKLQFGGSLLSTSWNRVTDRRLNVDTEDLVNRKRDLQLAIPTISYSLNIANAQSGGTTIEARPTLLISDGTQSKIFTGGTLTYASDGQLASNSFTREVGLSLAVKPEFISDTLVNLTVSTSLEVFTNSPSPGTFRQTLQTEKSATEISTDMRIGETVLIYGGKTTQSERNESKTPLLGDVPLLRNAFNARSGAETESGLLILLSLREREDDTDTRELAERRAVDQLSTRLFGSALPPVQRRLRIETSPRFYQLANPGRQFDAAYLADIGVDPSLLAAPRP